MTHRVLLHNVGRLLCDMLTKFPCGPILEEAIDRVDGPGVQVPSERHKVFNGQFEGFQRADIENPDGGRVECPGNRHLLPS